MRTTIEISDNVRAQLLRIAAQRGMKGFSQIVEEAISQYLGRLNNRDHDMKKASKLKGCLSEEEANDILDSISDIRKTWRV